MQKVLCENAVYSMPTIIEETAEFLLKSLESYRYHASNFFIFCLLQWKFAINLGFSYGWRYSKMDQVKFVEDSL